MRQLNFQSPQLILKAIAFCVLIGLLWSNAASYYGWMMDKNGIAVEICDPLDGENEKKELEEKLDDKVRTAFSAYQTQAARLAGRCAYAIYYLRSLHHPEILTPPPEPNAPTA